MGPRSLDPRVFKEKIDNFAPQFSGYNQQDSQVSMVTAKAICTFLVSFFRFSTWVSNVCNSGRSL